MRMKLLRMYGGKIIYIFIMWILWILLIWIRKFTLPYRFGFRNVGYDRVRMYVQCDVINLNCKLKNKKLLISLTVTWGNYVICFQKIESIGSIKLYNIFQTNQKDSLSPILHNWALFLYNFNFF